MGRLTIKRVTRKSCTIHTDDIPIGEVFYAKLGDWTQPVLFLRTFDGLVDLEKPSKTWHHPKFDVFEYEPVDAEIVVTNHV